MSWADEHLKDDFKVHSFTTNKDGEVTSEKHVRAGRAEETAVQIPDPKIVTKTTTQYDRSGEVVNQWVMQKPEDKQREEMVRAWAEALKADIPVLPLIPLLTDIKLQRADLMTVYPVGDHHLGMLAWKHEVGASYDIEIGEALLTKAMEYLVTASPPSEYCLIPVLGDFVHYDGFDSVTPTSRNLLDSDGRAPKMISAAARVLRRVIEFAAQKHRFVRVILELGNHDLISAVWLATMVEALYEGNDRISVDLNSGHFHYHEFGNNLLGTHHGHGRRAKPADLPQIMAVDQREAWGRTQNHMWMTGHIHCQNVYEFAGCKVETFPILAPGDAYSYNEGYRSRREMKALIYHREHGEVSRLIVTPGMLEVAT